MKVFLLSFMNIQILLFIKSIFGYVFGEISGKGTLKITKNKSTGEKGMKI